MQKLKIDLGSCVRASSKYSQCTKCHDICPIENKGIEFNENIALINDSCIDCGGCIGVCPSESISLKGFNTTEFLLSFLESKQRVLTCKSELPCIATLSVEHLISSVLISKDNISIDLSHCKDCEIGSLKTNIEKNIDEANQFLSNLNIKNQLLVEEDLDTQIQEEKKELSNRREFLKKLSPKEALKTKIKFEKEIEEIDRRKSIDSSVTAKMKEKFFPDKRKIFFMALKRIDKNNETNIILNHEQLSFISQKSIDESCDNCSFCYRMCPTEALSSDKRGSKIDFDPLSCIKCHLCHDVCLSNSIHLEDFNLQNILQPKVDRLIEFKVIRCEECANFFSQINNETLCPRCKIEDEEARRLWGIQ